MKIRSGFVSNSSTSSFFVDLGRYPEIQREFLIMKILEWEKSDENEDCYRVTISPDRMTVEGFTVMNNEDSAYTMLTELQLIGHAKFDDE